MILKRNSTGIEVANWQRFLISQGYKIDADGDFGAKTEHATQQWQYSQSLIADGIVGNNSFKKAEELTKAAKINLGSQKPVDVPISNHSPVSNARLQKVNPVLGAKCTRLMELAKADGIELIVTQGLRTFAEQDALFRKRPKVTNARGGQSMHNYGLAVDFAVMVNGKISWDEKLYRPLGKYCEIVRLEWGGNWKRFVDLPHVQLLNLPNYKTLLPIFNRGGLKAVWAKYSNE